MRLESPGFSERSTAGLVPEGNPDQMWALEASQTNTVLGREQAAPANGICKWSPLFLDNAEAPRS